MSSADPTTKVVPTWDGQKPVVLWVDDHPENNTDERAHAEARGTYLVLATDTMSAADFLRRHVDQLKDLGADQFRIVTDASRAERRTVGKAANPDAGISFIDEARTYFEHTPILVYCGKRGFEYWMKEKFLDDLDNVFLTIEQAPCLHFVTMGDVAAMKEGVERGKGGSE